MPSVSITNVALTFDNKNIFSNINLELPKGKWIALLGPSGIGKSSLLRMIAGLTPKQNSSGKIAANNHISLHQQIAYMAQTDLLLPWLNVLDNATIGLKLRKENSLRKAEALSLLCEVGMGDAMHLFPHQLSGGMRQRVALVRTLIEDKPIILMDEPFAAVDAITRYKLQNLAAELLRDKTVFFITHDPTEALRLAHEIYIMHGQPASLKCVTTLDSMTPRALTDIDLVNLQSQLFEELVKVS